MNLKRNIPPGSTIMTCSKNTVTRQTEEKKIPIYVKMQEGFTLNRRLAVNLRTKINSDIL